RADMTEWSTGSQTAVRVWDAATRTVVFALDGLSCIDGLPSFSPDGAHLAAAFVRRGIVRVWDVKTGQEACSFPNTGMLTWKAVFSSDGTRVAACGDDGVQVWDVASGKPVLKLRAESRAGFALAYSPDGKRIALGGIDGVVEVWEAATGRRLHTFKGHTGAIDEVAFSPDGTRLATGGADGTWRVWDTAASLGVAPIPRPESAEDAPRFGPDGRTLLTGVSTEGVAKVVQLWDTTTGAPRGGPVEFPQTAVGQAWSSDGARLYVADMGKAVTVLDTATGKVARRFPIEAETARASSRYYPIAVSPDERWCAYPGPGKMV